MTQRHGRGRLPCSRTASCIPRALMESSLWTPTTDTSFGNMLTRYPEIFPRRPLDGYQRNRQQLLRFDDSVYIRKRPLPTNRRRTGKLIAEFTAPKTIRETTESGDTSPTKTDFLGRCLIRITSSPIDTTRRKHEGSVDGVQDLLRSGRDDWRVKWRYDAKHSLRHNGIAIAAGIVILIDRPVATVDLRHGAAGSENTKQASWSRRFRHQQNPVGE